MKGVGHKIFMDNYFSSPMLDDLLGRKINLCRTVRHNQRAIPQEIAEE